MLLRVMVHTKEPLMNPGVETAFNEMIDISTDIQKALLYGPEGVLFSNMDEGTRTAAVAQAQELVRQGELKAADMGSQPMTQMVVKMQNGMVFLVKEPEAGGIGILATGKKDSRIGLALYDLKTCLKDARAALSDEAAVAAPPAGEE
jgi:predicted regulator of Ras-like GTPase activity (Roadblock/LC7/MglB family)